MAIGFSQDLGPPECGIPLRVGGALGSAIYLCQYHCAGCNVMPPPAATLWLFRTFDEDDRKITKKAHTPEPAARAVCLRPYKTSDISNRSASLRASEQYHQMCGKSQIRIPESARNQNYAPPHRFLCRQSSVRLTSTHYQGQRSNARKGTGLRFKEAGAWAIFQHHCLPEWWVYR